MAVISIESWAHSISTKPKPKNHLKIGLTIESIVRNVTGDPPLSVYLRSWIARTLSLFGACFFLNGLFIFTQMTEKSSQRKIWCSGSHYHFIHTQTMNVIVRVRLNSVAVLLAGGF